MRSAIALLLVTTACWVFAEDAPQVKAQSVLVVEESSGKVLHSKAPDVRRFPASTTKILTTLLLLEMCAPGEVIVAPADVETVTGASLHLKPGEAVKARDMAYALMLRSANDACYAVAVHLAGSASEFARLMNERAKRMGCVNSNFTNPHGLHDPNHYTTARDLWLITREALKNPQFRKIAATRTHTIERNVNLEDLLLVSKNRFLEKDPTADGVKTGYTRPAGSCYVGSATRNGFRIVTILLSSDAWQDDHKALLDWAFKNHTRSVVGKPGDEVGAVSVSGGPDEGVPVRLAEPVYYAHRKGVRPALKVTIEPLPSLSMPIAEGQRVGFALYSDGRDWSVRAPVTAATSALARPSGSGLMASLDVRAIAFAAMLGAGAYALRRKARRMAHHASAERR